MRQVEQQLRNGFTGPGGLRRHCSWITHSFVIFSFRAARRTEWSVGPIWDWYFYRSQAWLDYFRLRIVSFVWLFIVVFSLDEFCCLKGFRLLRSQWRARMSKRPLTQTITWYTTQSYERTSNSPTYRTLVWISVEIRLIDDSPAASRGFAPMLFNFICGFDVNHGMWVRVSNHMSWFFESRDAIPLSSKWEFAMKQWLFK